MILIPEIETVLILVPRTGSGTLRRAVAKTYPNSMLVYRHMEADGLPLGYDHWKRLGVVRDPIDRLWSLYKFLADFSGDHDASYIKAMRDSAARPFSEWIVENETVFTSPYDRAGHGRYWPGYTVRHPLPENRKSQRVYLRPDLGTQVYGFEQIDEVARRLKVSLGDRHNSTGEQAIPPLTHQAIEYIERVFRWDLLVRATMGLPHPRALLEAAEG